MALVMIAAVAIAGEPKTAHADMPILLAQAEQGTEVPGGALGQDGLTGAVTGRPVLSVVPSLSVSERYDSNVFFVPGQNREDFVTTISPQVRVEEKARLLSGSLQAGATAETYANNPGLNYVGVNVGLNLSLDNAVKRWIPRASLQVTDFFAYTPQPPAFLNPEAQAAGQSDVFARGIQPVRADSYRNTSTVAGSYVLSPRVSLQASYAYSFNRFGKTFATPAAGGVFDTTNQTVNLGGQTQVTRLDSMNVTYTYAQSDFGSGSGAVSQFKTHAGSLGWSHGLTQTLRTSLTGGTTWIDAGMGSTRLASYTGSASLTWQQKISASTLSYSRSVTPSTFVAATALISDVVSVSLSLPLTDRLSASGSANYGRNDSKVNDVSLSFESYGGTIGFSYAMTPWIAAIGSYSYNRFKQTFEGSVSEFDRKLATLTIRAEWK